MGLNLAGLRALFEPGSIAVLGASSDPSKIGGRPISFLRDNGFTGSIYPINPRHQEIQGLAAFPSLPDVAHPVDLALVAVPQPAVLDAVQSCADAGVAAVTVFSAGFAETGSAEGVSLQARMASIGREAGMRILGPNCLGSVSHRHGVSASFAASESVQRPAGNVGGVALISQSGAIAAYCVLAGLDRGVTFDPWISTGNESDVQLADCLAYLALDDEVKVIAAYLEGCRDGGALRAALALARERSKPVVLLKAGRSEVGSIAAASHTASLVGSEETFQALIRQYNVCRAESLDDLIGLCYTFGFAPPPTGTRTGIVTSSGGAGILMADAAADSGLDMPPLPAAAQAQLHGIWPAAGVGNPVDTTAQVVNDGQLLSDFLQTVLRAGNFDSLIIFLSYIGLFPRLVARGRGRAARGPGDVPRRGDLARHADHTGGPAPGAGAWHPDVRRSHGRRARACPRHRGDARLRPRAGPAARRRLPPGRGAPGGHGAVGARRPPRYSGEPGYPCWPGAGCGRPARRRARLPIWAAPWPSR